MSRLIVFCLVACGLMANSVWADDSTAAPAAQPAKTTVAAPAAQPAVAAKTTVAAPAAQPAVAAKTTVAAPAAPVKAAAVADDDSAPNPAFCFGRGLSNLALCWLEIPRCVVYDNAEIPFFGILVGIPEGALLTVARVGSGVFDILSLGFSGDALHGKRFPDFIWESKWMPKEKEK